MTTTINVSSKGQMALPKAFLKRRKIRTGTSLRVTEVANGLYVTPVLPPTENELRQVIAAAGSLTAPQTAHDEETVRQTIAAYRETRRRRCRRNRHERLYFRSILAG